MAINNRYRVIRPSDVKRWADQESYKVASFLGGRQSLLHSVHQGTSFKGTSSTSVRPNAAINDQ